MTKKTDDDLGYMRNALTLARRGLGQVWPNPAVGCVLVHDDDIVGRGWTQPGGRPHAEAEALARAGKRASGATAYVTLEPCSHHGRTPPCAHALIDAAISRAVIAVTDPNPRVDGDGLKMLTEAGISVDLGLCAEEASQLNAGFFCRQSKNRPYVTLKCASTIDARIATRSGDNQWITGDAARNAGHLIRATHDAVLVGSLTALQDNPSLTCRLPGLEARSPVRIVLDGRMQLPLTHDLVVTAEDTPTWIVTLRPKSGDKVSRRDAYIDAGVKVIEVDPDQNGHPDVAQALSQLSDSGITRLMVEGGGQVAASFISARMVDEIVWFRAPCIIGGDGLPALAGIGVDELLGAPRPFRMSTRTIGDDIVEHYRIQG